MWILYKDEVTGRTKKFQFKMGQKPQDVIPEADPDGTVTDWKIVVFNEENKEEGQKLNLTGYAVLREDPEKKVRYWDTYNGEGEAHTKLSPLQPLVFPTRLLPLGTRIELFQPEEV